MGSCIICGTSVDGHICETHQQDVVFEFRGSHPSQLTPGRFYRGTVDGYAEFGVFVDVGDRVTGLLHRSELDQRLESLAWESGDDVYVQVKNVRDNGNVDLGWSIRQSKREFRGTLIDDPDEDHELLAAEVEDESETTDADGESSETSSRGDDGPVRQEVGQVPSTSTSTSTSASTENADATDANDRRTAGKTGQHTEESVTGGTAVVEGTKDKDGGESKHKNEDKTTDNARGKTDAVELELVVIDSLGEHVGENVRVEGEIVDIRQTSGPTVFELRDETGIVDCAAFKKAGVRAYPEVETGDVVRLDGEVRRRRGELQIETDALLILEDEEREAVTERMADALTQQARPDDVSPLATDEAVDAVLDDIRDAATEIRRAVLEDRPIVIRHTATADGYVAGVAIERATLPLVRKQHSGADAEYHYFDRRPLEDGVYDMEDATNDVTEMLDNRERHDEKLPLFVFAAAGATRESVDGFDLLDIYGADRVVIDAADADEAVANAVDTIVSPSLTDTTAQTTASALAANVAVHVNDDARTDLAHLPAVSFWEETPSVYVDAAAEAGYDDTDTREIREAIALEAFYQSYEDKRELITDLLFPADESERGLAGHISEQFRTKLSAEIETAEANLETRETGGVEFAVLDTESYTHRYEFPPNSLLLDELYRAYSDEVDAVVGLAADELFLRSDTSLDVHAIADTASESVPDAGLAAKSARDGRLEFLSGERDAVLTAVIDTVADRM